jgi:hypothetical protein
MCKYAALVECFTAQSTLNGPAHVEGCAALVLRSLEAEIFAVPFCRKAVRVVCFQEMLRQPALFFVPIKPPTGCRNVSSQSSHFFFLLAS